MNIWRNDVAETRLACSRTSKVLVLSDFSSLFYSLHDGHPMNLLRAYKVESISSILRILYYKPSQKYVFISSLFIWF